MSYIPVIGRMMDSINGQIAQEGKIPDSMSVPILQGFTDNELRTIRLFLKSFDFSTFER